MAAQAGRPTEEQVQRAWRVALVERNPGRRAVLHVEYERLQCLCYNRYCPLGDPTHAR